MVEKSKVQLANALISTFIKEYETKYGKKPVINRYASRWGFESMYEDLGYERAKEVIQFYFRTSNPTHPVDTLLRKYEQFNVTYNEMLFDEEKRAKLRRETAERVKAWEEKNEH